MRIAIKIKDCSECPNFQSERVYTADSFETVYTWKCTPHNRIIKRYVETFDKVPIPEWCPIKIDE
jgi:hypothetical protein